MDNKFIVESYYDYSSKLGNRAVALSLSGLGIIWLFKTDTDSGAWLTSKLLLPGALFVCSVALDLTSSRPRMESSHSERSYASLSYEWTNTIRPHGSNIPP